MVRMSFDPVPDASLARAILLLFPFLRNDFQSLCSLEREPSILGDFKYHPLSRSWAGERERAHDLRSLRGAKGWMLRAVKSGFFCTRTTLRRSSHQAAQK